MPPTHSMRVRDMFDSDELTPEVLGDLMREINVIAVKLCVGMHLRGIMVTAKVQPGEQPELNMHFVTTDESDAVIKQVNEIAGNMPLPKTVAKRAH